MRNILIILFSISIIFFSCVNPTNDNSESEKYYITIKNESSFPLTNVKFLNLPFETVNKDLPVSGHASKEITKDIIGKSGYITFEFENTPGVTCRTDAWLTVSDNNLNFLFINETIVEELNNSNNRKLLSQITFSRIEVERKRLSVIKNDIVQLGETAANFISQHEFTIKNIGAGKLKLIGNEPVKINSSTDVFFIIQPSSSEINPDDTLTFIITFLPKAVQPYTAQVIISSDDLNGDFIFAITAIGTVPKPIAVINYLTTEVDQDGTINIDEVLITQTKIFNVVIKNIGTELLTIEPDNITITGADESAFTKITNPSSSISINSQTSFNIEFKPTREGENNVTLIIPTNDVSRNPVVVFIKGIGKKGNAVLQLTQGTTTITNNSITPLNFGQVDVGASKPLTFTIKNTGNIDLQLTGEPIVSSSNTAFSITVQPASSVIYPENEIHFIIQFTPVSESAITSTITILNNSNDLQFSFSVIGNGYIKKPQITLKQEGTLINAHGEYNFGNVAVGEPKDVIFTIENTGYANLTFQTVNNNRINLENNNGSNFTVITQPTAVASIAPENSTNFTVRFNPTIEESNFTASITIKSNSRDNEDFIFNLKGNGYIKRPQIVIKQSNKIIPQNGEYNLGSVLKGQIKDIVFTIENSGEADLNFVTVNNNRINLEDNNLGYFSVIQQPFASTIVSSKSSTTFTIRFNPNVAGNNFTASVHINTNSHLNGIFSFWIIGNCSNSYSVGDIGPGGGLIFFAQGGQYKEVSSDLGSYDWSTAKTTASSFKGGGFTGWYLPDRGELDLIYENLYRQGLGGFSNGSYWSSTLYSSYFSYYYYKSFSGGFWDWTTSYSNFFRVCAVRAFTMN